LTPDKGNPYDHSSVMSGRARAAEAGQAGARIGCDVGGTFTDFVLAENDGSLRHLKVPSTPASPAEAVLAGLRDLNADTRSVDAFIHGTTLAVNTIIQRAGARTGLLVTRGFRDILELARLRLSDPTNYFIEKPVPLVARHLVAEIDERMLATGRPYLVVDESQVIAEARRLVEDGAEALAICFMHSYRNADHERRALDAVRHAFPDLYTCASSAIWPQQNEYERCLVTVMNAYVGQRMVVYFGKLEADARELGITCGIFSTRSNGGIMTVRSAAVTPVSTLLSGPASGVMGALHVAAGADEHRIVTLDMGGTSADVSVIDRAPSYATDSQVGGLPVIMPAIDISSIGAGGGSIAWTDSGGALKVGPRSAGSDPGPACYRRGGVEPTVTDAYVELGLVDPDEFLGGALHLDPAPAHDALERLGRQLALDAIETATGIVAVATANMYAQFMPLMAGRGVDPRDFTLVAYGGAGPTHAFLLAREVGITTVLVPLSPGTLCALGCLVMDLRNDFVASVGRGLEEVSPDELERTYRAIEERAAAWLADERADVLSQSLVRTGDMRYRGQSSELAVILPAAIDTGALGEIRRRFEEMYLRTYGFHDAAAPVEIVNARVTVIGATRRPTDVIPQADSGPAMPQIRSRRVRHDGRWIEVGVYRRSDLGPGAKFPGPAIVEQYDTTVFVTPEFDFEIDRKGNLIGRTRRAAA